MAATEIDKDVVLREDGKHIISILAGSFPAFIPSWVFSLLRKHENREWHTSTVSSITPGSRVE